MESNNPQTNPAAQPAGTAPAKPKKRGGLIALIVIVVIVIIAVSGSKAKSFSQELKSGDNAYAEVVRVTPAYSVTTTTKAISVGEQPNGILCSCETKNGREIWVFFSLTEYQRDIDATADFVKGEGILNYLQYDFTGKDDVSFPSARKFYGTAKKLSELEGASMLDTGDTLYLDYEKTK